MPARSLRNHSAFPNNPRSDRHVSGISQKFPGRKSGREIRNPNSVPLFRRFHSSPGPLGKVCLILKMNSMLKKI
ncbi:unnamed protein product [Larinioides sclopetarius]|uniref:Uncharacterized protein n=1 Tax=Larinioides sclopetarius TaxID=280406 RepID=A0AAV2B9Y3_9ARAC